MQTSFAIVKFSAFLYFLHKGSFVLIKLIFNLTGGITII